MAKRWYSVSVLSNFEKKVAEQIKQAVADAGLEEDAPAIALLLRFGAFDIDAVSKKR